MNTYILILFFHVGIWGDTDSNATTVAQFGNKAACEAAGTLSKTLVANTKKEVSYVCVKAS